MINIIILSQSVNLEFLAYKVFSRAPLRGQSNQSFDIPKGVNGSSGTVLILSFLFQKLELWLVVNSCHIYLISPVVGHPVRLEELVERGPLGRVFLQEPLDHVSDLWLLDSSEVDILIKD